MPAFREYFEVFQLFHLAKIFHGTKKEQKNVASDDLPDREGVRPPKQGGRRGKDTRKGGCRRNRRWGRRGRRWQGRQSSEGLYFKIHPRLSRPVLSARGWIFPRLASKLKEMMARFMTKQKLFIRCIRQSRTNYEFLHCA